MLTVHSPGAILPRWKLPLSSVRRLNTMSSLRNETSRLRSAPGALAPGSATDRLNIASCTSVIATCVSAPARTSTAIGIATRGMAPADG